MAIHGRSIFEKFGMRSRERESDRDNPNSGAHPNRNKGGSKGRKERADEEKAQRQERTAFHASLKSSRTEVQRLTNSFVDLNKEVKKLHSSLKNINAITTTSTTRRTRYPAGADARHGSDNIAKFIKENPQFKGNKLLMDSMRREMEATHVHHKGVLASMRRAFGDVYATFSTIAPGLAQSISEILHTAKQLTRFTWPIFRGLGFIGKKLFQSTIGTGKDFKAAGRAGMRGVGRGIGAAGRVLGRAGADLLGVSGLGRGRRRRGGADEDAEVRPDARGAELSEEVKQSQLGMAANIQTMTDLFTGDGAWVRIKNPKDVGAGGAGAGAGGGGVLDWIKGGIGALLGGLLFKPVRNLLKTVFKKVFRGGKDLLKKLWDGGKNLVKRVWEGGKNLIKKVWEGGKNLVKKVWDTGKKFFTKTVKTVPKATKSVIKTISENWPKIKEFFKRGVAKTGNAWEWIKDAAKTAAEKVRLRTPVVDPRLNRPPGTLPAAEPHPIVRGPPERPTSPNRPSPRPQIRPTGPKIKLPTDPRLNRPPGTLPGEGWWSRNVVRPVTRTWKAGKEATVAAFEELLKKSAQQISRLTQKLKTAIKGIGAVLFNSISAEGNVAFKALGKIAQTILKYIPIAGFAYGCFLAYDRGMKGDYLGAGMEALIGILSFGGVFTIPLTASLIGLLWLYDSWRADAAAQQKLKEERTALDVIDMRDDPEWGAMAQKATDQAELRKQMEFHLKPHAGKGAVGYGTPGKAAVDKMLQGMDKFKAGGGKGKNGATVSPISFNAGGSTEADMLKDRARFDAMNALVNASARPGERDDDRLTRAIYTLAETVVLTSRQGSVTRPQPNLATEVSVMPQVAAYSLGTV